MFQWRVDVLLSSYRVYLGETRSEQKQENLVPLDKLSQGTWTQAAARTSQMRSLPPAELTQG